MACSKHQRFVETCPYCQDEINAIVAQNVERDRDTLKAANRAMLEVLLLVQDGESCVCDTPRSGDCLGCQVDSAIKLAMEGE